MNKPKVLRSYLVSWTIDVEADNPLDAAWQVAAWMQDGFTPDDDAFDVTDSETGVTTHVDLADNPQGTAAP